MDFFPFEKNVNGLWKDSILDRKRFDEIVAEREAELAVVKLWRGAARCDAGLDGGLVWEASETYPALPVGHANAPRGTAGEPVDRACTLRARADGPLGAHLAKQWQVLMDQSRLVGPQSLTNRIYHFMQHKPQSTWSIQIITRPGTRGRLYEDDGTFNFTLGDAEVTAFGPDGLQIKTPRVYPGWEFFKNALTTCHHCGLGPNHLHYAQYASGRDALIALEGEGKHKLDPRVTRRYEHIAGRACVQCAMVAYDRYQRSCDRT